MPVPLHNSLKKTPIPSLDVQSSNKQATILMVNRRRQIRITTLSKQGQEQDLVNSTPEERLAMMWQLTITAWLFKGERIAESGLSRHITNLQR